MRAQDFSEALERDLSQVKDIPGLCKDWQAKYRAIAVAAQGVLKVFFPAGATLLGYLIQLADSVCSLPADSRGKSGLTTLKEIADDASMAGGNDS